MVLVERVQEMEGLPLMGLKFEPLKMLHTMVAVVVVAAGFS
jgi:hypothetical protein